MSVCEVDKADTNDPAHNLKSMQRIVTKSGQNAEWE
jgi:hypothetical protein